MFALRATRLHSPPLFHLLAAPFVPEARRARPTRSFFGALRVWSRGRAVRFFFTAHTGADAFARFMRPVPLPSLRITTSSRILARSLDFARAASGRASGDFRTRIVGLGIGAIACYKRPGETWRFYEIDPAVVELARDGSQFTYLSTCQPAADIVVGDARLTLAKEKPHIFDYLLLDAFSSDAVPTHLLTAEAIAMYLGKLADRGVLVIHVSNRILI